MLALPLRSTLVALTLAALAGVANAAAIQPFSMAALKAAQAHGQPILVDAHADWCPTCRAQAPTIMAISKDPAYSRLVILKLDYDNQVQEKRALGIQHQSTLIAFAGARETARATGITDPGAIRALAASAVR